VKEGEVSAKRGVNVEASSSSPAGRETYYQRWKRLHPKISPYLKREEYERLKEAAAFRNMTVKDFVLSLIEGFKEGYARALEDFVDDPGASTTRSGGGAPRRT
jgi:hypothetical protein